MPIAVATSAATATVLTTATRSPLRGDLAAVTRAILLDYEARSPAVARRPWSAARRAAWSAREGTESSAATDGVAVLEQHHPDVHIYTPTVDPILNAHKYIVPGLGDFGDRLYGTL